MSDNMLIKVKSNYFQLIKERSRGNRKYIGKKKFNNMPFHRNYLTGFFNL